MAKTLVGQTVESLGDYLKEQRVASRLSLRQLAAQAGVSNPYLSQIERGLRKPSAEVLQQIARALRISAEQLYIRAGIVSPDDGVGGSVELAVLNDTGLTERQKQSLLDVYSSFLAMNEVKPTEDDKDEGRGDPEDPCQGPEARTGAGTGAVTSASRQEGPAICGAFCVGATAFHRAGKMLRLSVEPVMGCSG